MAAHPFKKVADDILEAILESGPRIGRGLADRTDNQAVKIRKDIDAVKKTDKDLAGKQKSPDTNVKKPKKNDADPNGKPLKDPVKTGDVDTYKNLKDRAVKGDKLEHDHIPSAAALIRAAERRKRRSLEPHEVREIYNNAAAIELPSSTHRRTRTYGGKNKQAQINQDASDLSAAANADYSDRIALMLEDGVPLDQIETSIRKLIAMNKERGIG